MPYASKAQARWMHANKPEMAKEWDAATLDMKKLPQHVKKHKTKSVEPKLPKGYHSTDTGFMIPSKTKITHKS